MSFQNTTAYAETLSCTHASTVTIATLTLNKRRFHLTHREKHKITISQISGWISLCTNEINLYYFSTLPLSAASRRQNMKPTNKEL